MNEHKKARRLIHAQIDGRLSQADDGWLNHHLQNCTICQAYRTDILRLDAGLRQHYLSLNQTYLKNHSSSLSLIAIDSILNQSRAKMNTRKFTSTLSSLSYVLVLIVLAGAFAWLLGTYFLRPVQLSSPIRATNVPGISISTATSEPAVSPEINDPSQIISVLEGLANKNMILFLQTGWLHEQMRDAGESGMLQTSYNETWTHYPDGDGASAEFLSLTKDKPEGVTYYQFTVRLSDGTSGDLIQLRQGAGQPEGTGPVSLPSKMSVDQTQAGRLAARIIQARQASGSGEATSKINDLHLQYTTFDGKPAVLVSATFETPKSTPPVQVETRTFDLESGLLLKEHIIQEWTDGAVFAEFASLHQTEYVKTLPPETLTTFELAASELNAHQAQATVAVAATGNPATVTPMLAADTSLLDSLPYTQANPTNDGQIILKILDALLQRHLSWMSRPGWKLFGPTEVKSKEWDLYRFVLTHVVDSSGLCEQMTYYVKDEKILPQEIWLGRGRWGLVGSVEDGAFTEGKLQGEPCRVENSITGQRILNERDYFNGLLTGKMEGEYAAWVEEIDGQRVFVLYKNIHYQSPKPVTMDPDTRKLETEDRSLDWSYFDLETGGMVDEKSQVYLENGKVFGEPPIAGQKPSLTYQQFENLPPFLAQVFEKTILDLNNYLAKLNQ